MIRGLDRSRTVLDGGFTRDNGIKVLADGVAVENMTARNYTNNGFFWTGVKGYRGSYLTAIRNGDYGIYAFDSTYGPVRPRLRRRQPRRGLLHRPVLPVPRGDHRFDRRVERHRLLRHERGRRPARRAIGVAQQPRRHRARTAAPARRTRPQHGMTIVGNTVYGNNNAKTAAIDIAAARDRQRHPRRRRQRQRRRAQPRVRPRPRRHRRDPAAGEGHQPRRPQGDQLRRAPEPRSIGNDVRDSRAADLALVTSITDAKDAGGNCFSGNSLLDVVARRTSSSSCRAAGRASPAYETDLARFVAAAHRDEAGRRRLPARSCCPTPPEPPRHARRGNAPARPTNAGIQVDLRTIAVQPAEGLAQGPATRAWPQRCTMIQYRSR